MSLYERASTGRAACIDDDDDYKDDDDDDDDDDNDYDLHFFFIRTIL